MHDRLESALHEAAGHDLLEQHLGPSALHHLAHRAAQDPCSTPSWMGVSTSVSSAAR